MDPVPQSSSVTFEQLDRQYRQVSSQLGEAYVAFDTARKSLNLLRKQRDAIIAQYNLFQRMTPPCAPVEGVKDAG